MCIRRWRVCDCRTCPEIPMPAVMDARQPAPSAEGTSLDEAALARLRDLDPEGRHGVVVRVLGAYESSLERQIAQLRVQEQAAVSPARTQAVAALAHTMKSSSASVGALLLARTCESLERRLRDGAAAQTHDVAELIALGESALVAARTILRG
jgi:HPt (histidine-containing phosphotransfer) domain-containing protein